MQEDTYRHQVTLALDLPANVAAVQMDAMIAWLRHWEIPHLQPTPCAAGRRITFAFDDIRFATAFRSAFGGTLRSPEGRDDEEEVYEGEDRYERLARAYPG